MHSDINVKTSRQSSENQPDWIKGQNKPERHFVCRRLTLLSLLLDEWIKLTAGVVWAERGRWPLQCRHMAPTVIWAVKLRVTLVFSAHIPPTHQTQRTGFNLHLQSFYFLNSLVNKNSCVGSCTVRIGGCHCIRGLAGKNSLTVTGKCWAKEDRPSWGT